MLDTLASVAKVRFFYNHSQVDGNKNVSFDVKDRDIGLRVDAGFRRSACGGRISVESCRLF